LEPTKKQAEARPRPYSPLVRMWPPATSPIVCALTVSSTESYTLFQGDPRTWEADEPARPVASAPRVPFALIRAWDFHLSLVVSGVTNSHEVSLSWDVRAADAFDMRLARFHLLRQQYHPHVAASLSRSHSRHAAAGLSPSQQQQSFSRSVRRRSSFAAPGGPPAAAKNGGVADSGLEQGRADVREQLQVVSLSCTVAALNIEPR
jgi:hypothetical protein